MVFASMFCCVKNSDRKEKGKKQLTWRIFSLKELQSATNNFNYDNKLGEGWIWQCLLGSALGWITGPVGVPILSHKLDPIINERFMQIAVKRLKVWSNKADMEFGVEVEILARVRHKNLLSLRGYCAEGQERLIVYDYMPNLSLASHLHGHHSAECLLDWKRRPERRPTMPDVIELLKGESKEKFSELENDEMFKAPQPAADDEISIAEKQLRLHLGGEGH
ncbi:hypothetical protein OIU77_023845 [Salix suchowensis]|uniref:Protein kinase domain-containing protein n=1 Tax=Salix suchowensis TaxID=1278906 RepID=A0ABQ9C9F4_9ROSI|nr:hypothetical protein OIU77_023845 [Salix suchowensis]